jgi:parallel beta-helix repeat protein
VPEELGHLDHSSRLLLPSAETPSTENSPLHHNYWHGIWCDGFAASIVIRGNVVHHNGKSGIRYEVCRGSGSKIINNRVFHNGYSKQHISRGRGGIVLAGARGVEVANNTVTGNRGHGIRAKASDRQSTSKVRIDHNSLREDTLQGCQLPGVLCRANHGVETSVVAQTPLLALWDQRPVTARTPLRLLRRVHHPRSTRLAPLLRRRKVSPEQRRRG